MDEKLRNVHQSHGMTHGEYEELKAKQQNNEVEFGDPNNFAAVTDKLFQQDFKDYQVAYHERTFYHIIQEARSFSIRGERLSIPYVQKYSVQNFKEMLSNKGFTGLDTAIIHDPTKESNAKKPDSFRHGETNPNREKELDQAHSDEMKRLQDQAAALATKEDDLAKREAELLKREEDLEAQKNLDAAQKETDLIIASLPGKTIADLNQFAADNKIDLTGATSKPELIAKISEALKPSPVNTSNL